MYRWTDTGMSDDLTPRQEQALLAVHYHREECGKDPSINELAERMDLTKSGAKRLLAELVRKGHMKKPEIVIKNGWRLTSKAVSRIRALLTATLLFSCGGGASSGPESAPEPIDLHPELYVPGQEGRIDGSVWEDGLFNSPEAEAEFCSSYDGDDAWFCDEPVADAGADVEKFQSAQLFGFEFGQPAGRPCYGPSTTNTLCAFPSQKKFRVRLDTTNCFSCTPGVGDCPNTLQEQTILDGAKAGIKKWNGKGGVVVVDEGTPGSSSYIPVRIGCADLPGTAMMSGGPDGNPGTSLVSDLPVAPNGKDERGAVGWDLAKVDVDVIRTWIQVESFCFPQEQTTTNIGKIATIVGAHEGGHVVGFGHFKKGDEQSNIMFAFAPFVCAPTTTIQAPFVDALSKYNPSAAGLSVVSDNGLTGLQPQ